MKSWLKYLLILIIFGVPLVFNPAYIDGYNLPKISMFYALTAAMLVLWVINCIREGKASIRISAVFFAGLLLVLANGLAAVFSINPLQSFWGQYRFHAFGLLPLITAFVFSFLVCQVDINDAIFNWAVFGVVLSTIYGMIGPGQESRMNATFGSPIYYSVFAAGLGPIALARCFEKGNRLMWFVSVIILGAGLIIANSRGAWVAFGISVIVFLLAALIRKQLKIKQVSVALMCVAALGACMVLNPASLNKFKNVLNINEFNNFSRHEGWKAGLEIIKEKPFLGVGPANFQLAFIRHKTLEYVRSVGAEMAQGHAHNDIIQTAATTGLVGLAAYLCFWVMLLIKGFKNTINGLFDTGIFAGLSAIFVFNQFNNGIVAELMLFWLMAGWVARQDKKAKVIQLRAPGGSVAVLAVVTASVFLINFTLKPLKAEMRFVEGNIAAVSGNLKEAFNDFEKAVEIQPLVIDYYKSLLESGYIISSRTGDGAERKNILDKAQKYALQNAAINKHDPDAYCFLGAAYVWKFQLLGEDLRGKAASAFLEAVKLDKYSAPGLSWLARVSNLSGRPEQAREYYKQVLDIDPQNSEALKNSSIKGVK